MKINIYGENHDKAILCLPGLFMSGECFSLLASKMPESCFICITLDGHDSKEEELRDKEDELDRIVELLEEKGYTEFELALGLSLGTIFVLELAKRPELQIKKLFLDGAVNLYSSKASRLEGYVMSVIFQNFRMLAKHKQILIRMLKTMYSEDWAANMQMCMSYLSKRSMKAIVSILTEYELQSGIHQPMCFLYGSKESNIAKNKNVIREWYPDAVIEVKKGYNHLFFLNQELDEYAKKVKEFMNL